MACSAAVYDVLLRRWVLSRGCSVPEHEDCGLRCSVDSSDGWWCLDGDGCVGWLFWWRMGNDAGVHDVHLRYGVVPRGHSVPEHEECELHSYWDSAGQ